LRQQDVTARRWEGGIGFRQRHHRPRRAEINPTVNLPVLLNPSEMAALQCSVDRDPHQSHQKQQHSDLNFEQGEPGRPFHEAPQTAFPILKRRHQRSPHKTTDFAATQRAREPGESS